MRRGTLLFVWQAKCLSYDLHPDVDLELFNPLSCSLFFSLLIIGGLQIREKNRKQEFFPHIYQKS